MAAVETRAIEEAWSPLGEDGGEPYRLEGVKKPWTSFEPIEGRQTAKYLLSDATQSEDTATAVLV